MEGEFEAVSAEFREFSTKMKDPLVVGALLHRLTEERTSTNLLLKEINAKLDRFEALEAKIAHLEAKMDEKSDRKVVMLPEVDEEIISFITKKGAVCAEDVQEKFEYKGKNAASARLNRLYSLGIVRKTQVGKKVFFEVQGTDMPRRG